MVDLFDVLRDLYQRNEEITNTFGDIEYLNHIIEDILDIVAESYKLDWSQEQLIWEFMGGEMGKNQLLRKLKIEDGGEGG